MNDIAFEQLKAEIRSYLQIKLPAHWNCWNLKRRHAFLSGSIKTTEPLHGRHTVCAVEIYYELYTHEDVVVLPVADSSLAVIDKALAEICKGEVKTYKSRLYGIQNGYLFYDINKRCNEKPPKEIDIATHLN